ncbi:MAG: cell division protein ZapA [Betaproteobacteria bacterium]|nr:cell division protein ZapA [Betaproteobacteria bacterium]
MKKTPTLDIKLHGREYSVACSAEERDALLAAAAHVGAKMEEIAGKTKSTGERLAVMTALNLAHELLAKPAENATPQPVELTPAASFDSEELTRRIGAMVARLDAAMAPQDKLF